MSLAPMTPPVGIGWRHPHYATLLEEKPGLDFIEVHSENFFGEGGAAIAVLERGRSVYDISLHGVGMSLGAAVGLDDWHLDQLASLVKRIDPVRVSDHASFACGGYQNALAHAADLLPLPFNEEALQVLCTNVQRVQDRLQRPILVENLSAYLAWRPLPEEQPLAEPEFLNSLARRTGCQLLVDVNNIYVNALNARRTGSQADPLQACRTWLDAIDPRVAGELHLAGHCHVSDGHGDIVIDDHGSKVAAPVWDLYGHAVARFGAVPTLIEWDTDVPVLEVLLQEAAHARSVGERALQLSHSATPAYPKLGVTQ